MSPLASFAVYAALIVLLGCLIVVAYDEADRRWGRAIRAWWDA